MSDVNRQRPQTDETDSEEQRDGGALLESDDNKGLSDVPIYNWRTGLQESNNEKSSTEGNKINEIETDELKENQDPSLNGKSKF